MVKVISLSNDAYERLKIRKLPGKSFSDVVVEMTEKKEKRPSIMDFFGALKDDKETIEILRKVVADRKNIKMRHVKF